MCEACENCALCEQTFNELVAGGMPPYTANELGWLDCENCHEALECTCSSEVTPHVF